MRSQACSVSASDGRVVFECLGRFQGPSTVAQYNGSGLVRRDARQREPRGGPCAMTEMWRLGA